MIEACNDSVIVLVDKPKTVTAVAMPDTSPTYEASVVSVSSTCSSNIKMGDKILFMKNNAKKFKYKDGDVVKEFAVVKTDEILAIIR